MADGKLNSTEQRAFAPGGSLSTPKQRLSRPATDFLDEANRKYPYKSDGKISCDMLRAAISRAGQQGKTSIENKARSLFKSNCGA